MSLDYDTAYATAREEAAFSNGTDFHDWAARWCDTCRQEADYRLTGEGEGCPLVLVALLGRTPAEWQGEHGSPTCAEYIPDEW